MANRREQIFVGRRREMADLRDALDDAMAGRGRSVMLAGEPGIGKTRTAQELASHAETLEAQVFWGRCYEEEGTPPYWPWLQLLRSYILQQTPKQLQAEMGSGAADIAEIVPELGVKLPNLETPPALEPEQARFRLFSSITNFLKNAAQSQPLMLVLDDLHWADRSSLLLLEFLAREIQSSLLLILGTYRDVEVSRRHPLSQTLGSLIREQRFLRVQLSGLAEAEVEQLIQMAVSIRPLPGLSVTIHRRTEGNPLFVTEIIRMLPPEGIGEGQDYLTSIPEGVRDAIGRRLNHLSEGCNQVLTTASVVGREFDFRLLSALMDDLTEASLLGLVDEALDSHVIEEVSAGEERYRFSHALIQETLADELSVSRKVRLHARAAEALETIYGSITEAHASELAYHFSEAESVLGPEKMVHYSLMAGEQALAAYAWEEAQGHFERGLGTKEGQPMDADTAALMFGLGRAKLATGEYFRREESFSFLKRAFDYYAEAGDVASAVAIAQNAAIRQIYQNSSEAAQLLARAFVLVSPESREAGGLLSRYIGTLGIQEADYSGSMEATNKCLAIALSAQDRTLELATIAQAAQVDRFHLHPRRALEKSLRAIELAGLLDDPRAEILVRGVAAGCSLVVGNLERARSHAITMLRLAERLGHRQESARACWWNAEVCGIEGDWRKAFEHSDRGLEVAPRDSRLLGSRAVLECQTGEISQSEDHLEQLLEVWRLAEHPSGYLASFPAVVIPVVNYITGVATRQDVAQNAAEAMLSSASLVPLHALTVKYGLALMAVQQGDIVAASEHYAAFESQTGAMLPGWIANVDHLLGLLSHAMGNYDQAVAHFQDAIDFCRKAGYRPELAWTCCDYAGALLQRNGPSDREKAISLLDGSLAISTELGMRPLMERVVAHQERAESQPVAAPAYPDGLTQREVEVLRHVAAGKTDRGIAEELFLSTRTVTTHVSNILNKTNAANRAEAAAYASRNGLA